MKNLIQRWTDKAAATRQQWERRVPVIFRESSPFTVPIQRTRLSFGRIFPGQFAYSRVSKHPQR
jgi:hypothetical protein